MEFTKNAKNIKLSERTKDILIALAAFEESFWKVSELLTEQSDDEETQEAFVNVAEKEQKEANLKLRFVERKIQESKVSE